MKKLLLLLALLLCAALIGCDGYDDIGADTAYTEDGELICVRPPQPTPPVQGAPLQTAPPEQAVPLQAAPLIGTNHGEQIVDYTAVARGANDFAFALGAALLRGAGNDNFVSSPFSVWLPLAALANGTNDDFLPQLLESLGAGGSDVSTLNRTASRMMFDLTRAAPDSWRDSPLHIANAVFADARYPLVTEFAQTFLDYFRGAILPIDFTAPAEAVAKINQWAYDNTNGRISNVVEEVSEDYGMAIANAIYFSCDWAFGFPESQTRRAPFYSPAGEIEVYMMRRQWTDGLVQYFEDANMQAITLNFISGGGLTIMLPKTCNAADLLANMTGSCFDRILTDSVMAAGVLELPRFTIENSLDNLIPALTALGLAELFCEFAAPLDGLMHAPPAFIAEAVQKAMIEVDEHGATAAAVTIMFPMPTSAPPPPDITFEMICNKPFAFVLHDRTQDGGRQVLFTGVVNAP